MLYLFYNNDPIGTDQGGGVAHFRSLFRVLSDSDIKFLAVSCRRQWNRSDERIEYIGNSPNILIFAVKILIWFIRNRSKFTDADVFHFHRNYLVWPKVLVIGRIGRTIVTYHGATGRYLEGLLGKRLSQPIRWISSTLEKRVLNYVDDIIFVSRRSLEEIKPIVGVNVSKTKIVPIGIDINPFLNIPPLREIHSKKILFVGRISEIKNIPLALSAIEILMKEDSDYTFTIAGDGEDFSEIQGIVNKSPNKNRISMVGRVEHQDIPELINNHGIILLTSRSEASPTILREALVSKRVMVSVDVGDVKDWIIEGKNGFVCVSTPESIARGIKKASDLIESGNYELGFKAEEFSEQSILGRVLELYR